MTTLSTFARRAVVVLLALLTISLPTVALAQQATPTPRPCPALSGSPADVRVAYYMGEAVAFFDSALYDPALNSVSCIIEQVNPAYTDAYILRARVYTQLRDYDRAIDDYDTAIAQDATNPATYNDRGVVYALIDATTSAQADFTRALERDAAYLPALNNRGVVHLIDGRYDQAQAAFESALALTDVPALLAALNNPNRDPNTPLPRVTALETRQLALLGVVENARSQELFNDYLRAARGSSDGRIVAAAGAQEARFTFDLRLNDGSWYITSDQYTRSVAQ